VKTVLVVGGRRAILLAPYKVVLDECINLDPARRFGAPVADMSSWYFAHAACLSRPSLTRFLPMWTYRLQVLRVRPVPAN
jgi:hypothetical protein